MRVVLTSMTLAGVLAGLISCSSQAIPDDTGQGGSGAGSGSTGGSKNTGHVPSACSGARRQLLSLVDQVSTSTVSILSEDAGERVIYVDATAGGISGGDKNPWVYISLATGAAVGLTDIEAITSSDWDLGFKRFVVRTNGGDSGPGAGGAFRVALPWDKVTAATLGQQTLPSESWFNAECMLVNVDPDTNDLITTFTGWSVYDEASHVLTAGDFVYITAGADGSLYKVAILDYYSTPKGGTGSVAGRYKVRIAPLQ